MKRKNIIKQLISKGNLKKALSKLLYWIDPENENYNSLVICSLRYHNITNSFNEGHVLIEQRNSELIKISSEIILLLDDLVDEKSSDTNIFELENNIKHSKVEIKIDKPFESYSEKEQSVLIRSIERLIRIPELSITIESLRPGSVLMTLKMPSKFVLKLIWLVRFDELKSYSVVNARIIGDINMPIKSDNTIGKSLLNKINRSKLILFTLFSIILFLIGYNYFIRNEFNRDKGTLIQSIYEMDSANLVLDSLIQKYESSNVNNQLALVFKDSIINVLDSMLKVQKNRGIGLNVVRKPTEIKSFHFDQNQENAIESTDVIEVPTSVPELNTVSQSIIDRFKDKQNFVINFIKDKNTNKDRKSSIKYKVKWQSQFLSNGIFQLDLNFELDTIVNLDNSSKKFFKCSFDFLDSNQNIIYSITSPHYILDYKFRQTNSQETFIHKVPFVVLYGTESIVYNAEKSQVYNKSINSMVYKIFEKSFKKNSNITAAANDYIRDEITSKIDSLEEIRDDLKLQIKLKRNDISNIEETKQEIRKKHKKRNNQNSEKRKMSKADLKKIKDHNEMIEVLNSEIKSIKVVLKERLKPINNLRRKELDIKKFLSWYLRTTKQPEIKQNENLFNQIFNQIEKLDIKAAEVKADLKYGRKD